MSKNKSFLFSNAGLGFGDYGPEDELWHPDSFVDNKDDGATETQYFGFKIPEENICGYVYCWHHPNLKTVTGGAHVWQGIKKHHLESELYDLRAYQSDNYVTKDISHHTMPCGVSIEIVEPFREMRIQYEDASRGNAFDVKVSAVAEPAMLPNRKHFEQIMKTTGSLSLRAKQYQIDSYFIRDRSWGETRPEEPMNLPPFTWLTGVFNDNFAFNFMGTDHPDKNPDWKGIYEIPAEAVLKGGWIYLNGNYTRIVKATKTTRRDKQTLQPTNIEIKVVDEAGQTFSFTGTVPCSSPSGFWYNAYIHVSMVRWQVKGPGVDGLTGWGDSQECQWCDYVYNMQN